VTVDGRRRRRALTAAQRSIELLALRDAVPPGPLAAAAEALPGER
jgi:hypothetical protein